MGDGNLADRLRSKYCTRLFRKDSRFVTLLSEQLSNCADQWRKIGIYLKFTQIELNILEVKNTYKYRVPDSSTLLNKMLQQWLQWCPGDSRGSNNYPCLEDLKDALRLAGFRETADNLHL